MPSGAIAISVAKKVVKRKRSPSDRWRRADRSDPEERQGARAPCQKERENAFPAHPPAQKPPVPTERSHTERDPDIGSFPKRP
jgi:hypothetical protein